VIDKRLYTTPEAAEYLAMEPGTLENWRYKQRGPKPTRLPGGSIRYDKVDLDAWVEAVKRGEAA
jgi:predicted DNA-binding transcriptional regulator AlpA